MNELLFSLVLAAYVIVVCFMVYMERTEKWVRTFPVTAAVFFVAAPIAVLFLGVAYVCGFCFQFVKSVRGS
jgi:Co/Zn/Cd efflux system component